MAAADSTATVVYRELDFLGFPGYRVGTDGSVWTRWQRNGQKNAVLGSVWVRLKPDVDKRYGHRRVTLYPDRKRVQVHRLVLLAFVGPCPPGMEACHGPDRDPSNNRLSNLRWDSHISNMQDAILHGTSTRGSRNSQALLSEADVLELRRRFADGETFEQLAVYKQTIKSRVYFAVSDKPWGSWRHLPYPTGKSETNEL